MVEEQSISIIRRLQYLSSLLDIYFSILGMKTSPCNFQEYFFEYQIPMPMVSIFSEEFVRSNDIRLLLQIATKSSLRMYTDSKTGHIHFICKLEGGAECFDIKAEPFPIDYGYYFTYDYLKIKHKKNCHQEKEAFEYLRIYNLMKLKKRLIEEYMIKMKLQTQSPSIILGKLSNHSEVYFFQKYLNGHIEYKRKLRKRFDNIINIDIKKIGKCESEQQKQEIKFPSKMSKARRLKLMKQRAKMAKFKAFHKPGTQTIHMIISSDHNKSLRDGQQERKARIKRISQKISKKNKKKMQKSSIIKLQHKSKQEEYLTKKEKIFEQEQSQLVKEQVLPEIMVLNEQAQYIWSESELDSSVQKQSEEMHLATNCEDYFKSLRNSALKQSLERQSLSFCFFSRESSKNNKQNLQ